MLNTYHPQIPQNIFYQSKETLKKQLLPRDVRQDKIALSRDRGATDQLAVPSEVQRSQQMGKYTHRLQNTSENHERTVPITLHVRPIVKDRLQLIARREGLKTKGRKPLSMSEVGGRYLDRGLQQHIDMQYGALLEPIIRKAVDEAIRPMSAQFRWLLVRIAFDANQSRSLVTNIFSRQPGITQEARENILKRLPGQRRPIFSEKPLSLPNS